MRCEQAREALSAALDEGPAAADEVAAHVRGCPSCAVFGERLQRLRRELRLEDLGEPPDVRARVRAQIDAEDRRTPQRTRGWWQAAAVFVIAATVGASLAVGAVPRGVVARALAEEVVAAQQELSALSARVEVVERGWHDDVGPRRFVGTLAYAAPERLRLELADETRYPDESAWPANDVTLAIDEDRAVRRGLIDCPRAALPACLPETPRTEAAVGREPFDPAEPDPLDLVVPVRSFAEPGELTELGEREIDGRRARGVRVDAAQVEPLLSAVTGVGAWRQVHPLDRAEVWLDADTLVPLEVTVEPAQTPQRTLWAARAGYDDPAGEPYLTVRLRDVAVGDEADEPQRLDVAESADRGFRDRARQDVAAPEPAWLPEGIHAHRAGVDTSGTPPVAVASYSDGRSWVAVRATQAWDREQLFGGLGAHVRELDLAGATAYERVDGSRIALHTDDLDVVVAGSLPRTDLRRVAASLDVDGQPVPNNWREAEIADLAEARQTLDGLLAPTELAGFAEPTVRIDGQRVTLAYAGSGDHALTLTQQPAEALPPPLDSDVDRVQVRGHIGRASLTRGVLEWVENGRLVRLSSDTLSLGKLHAIAETLESQ